jgi:hypothetical protein
MGVALSKKDENLSKNFFKLIQTIYFYKSTSGFNFNCLEKIKRFDVRR